MVLSCFSSKMCSEKKVTAELLKLEPLKRLNSFKIFFYKLELFWRYPIVSDGQLTRGHSLYVELKVS